MIGRLAGLAITQALLALAGFSGLCFSKPFLPIDGEICLTSSFGSWRRTHIHAGLDFSTGRKVGRGIYAIDTCRVSRISISSNGYGKALYLLLNNGMLAVYGHLSGFVPELESLVEAVQDSLASYEVDLFVKDRNITFKPGDPVAYSGETGQGPPHLHFEIRSDEDDSSRINPLLFYPELFDSFPPMIRTIYFDPIGPNATINGQSSTLRFARGKRQSVVRSAGRVGVGVEAVDPVGCGNYLLPHRYELLIDGVTVWRLAFDRFQSSLCHFVHAIYEISGGRRFVRLYPFNDIDYLSFKEISGNLISGPYDLTPGPHLLCVKVCDLWGNCDSVSIDLISERKPSLVVFDLFHNEGATGVKVRGENGSRIQLDYSILGGSSKKTLTSVERMESLLTYDTRPVEVICTIKDRYGFSTKGYFSTYPYSRDDRCDLKIRVKPTFLELVATCSRSPKTLPIAMINKPIPTSVILQPAGRNKFVGWVSGEMAEEAVDVTVGFEYVNGWLFCREKIKAVWISPGQQLEFDDEALKLTLKNPKESNYGSFISVNFSSSPTFEGFDHNGMRLEFDPQGLVYPHGIDLSICLENTFDWKGFCLYSLESGVPYFLARFDQEGMAFLKLYKLNPLLLLRDLQAPMLTIGNIRLRKDGKAIFTGGAYDSGSKIDSKSLTAYIDDKKAIVGIDPDTGRLDGRSINPLPYGKHRIRLEARDRAGNLRFIESVVNLIR
ncbi:MAG: M23 family metallopeptidase [bacterium]